MDWFDLSTNYLVGTQMLYRATLLHERQGVIVGFVMLPDYTTISAPGSFDTFEAGKEWAEGVVNKHKLYHGG